MRARPFLMHRRALRNTDRVLHSTFFPEGKGVNLGYYDWVQVKLKILCGIHIIHSIERCIFRGHPNRQFLYAFSLFFLLHATAPLFEERRVKPWDSRIAFGSAKWEGSGGRWDWWHWLPRGLSWVRRGRSIHCKITFCFIMFNNWKNYWQCTVLPCIIHLHSVSPQ